MLDVKSRSWLILAQVPFCTFDCEKFFTWSLHPMATPTASSSSNKMEQQPPDRSLLQLDADINQVNWSHVRHYMTERFSHPPTCFVQRQGVALLDHVDRSQICDHILNLRPCPSFFDADLPCKMYHPEFLLQNDVLLWTPRTWPCHAYQRRRDLWKQCWNCEIPHCGQLHRQGWEHSEMFGFRAWVAAIEPRYWFSVYCLEPNYSGRLPLYTIDFQDFQNCLATQRSLYSNRGEYDEQTLTIPLPTNTADPELSILTSFFYMKMQRELSLAFSNSRASAQTITQTQLRDWLKFAGDHHRLARTQQGVAQQFNDNVANVVLDIINANIPQYQRSWADSDPNITVDQATSRLRFCSWEAYAISCDFLPRLLTPGEDQPQKNVHHLTVFGGRWLQVRIDQRTRRSLIQFAGFWPRTRIDPHLQTFSILPVTCDVWSSFNLSFISPFKLLPWSCLILMITLCHIIPTNLHTCRLSTPSSANLKKEMQVCCHNRRTHTASPLDAEWPKTSDEATYTPALLTVYIGWPHR